MSKPSTPLAADPGPRPTIDVVLSLAAGSRLRTEVAEGDDPVHRAAAIWWREALRQSDRFDIGDEPGPAADATLVIALDPAGRRLSAFCRIGDSETALAGAAFPNGDLPGAIDRLAWSSRLALGEDAGPPRPVANVVSADVKALLAVVDGFALLADGGIESGRRAFQAARRRDGASPFVLDGLATVELMRGNAREAAKICREALTYDERMMPATQHRLARTLLLARASLDPTRAPDRDRELLTLGLTYQRERPRDPQGLLTVAIARNFLAEFETARPLLARLRDRLPRQAVVAYHSGWAALATGEPKTAITHFEDAALRLPMAWVAIPRALAHLTASDHDGLDRLLDRLMIDAEPRGGEPVHELQRIRAAHALLRGDEDAAAKAIIKSLQWLLKNPTLLDRRPGEFAETGEVLVRLGRTDGFAAVLAAIQGQLPGSAVADSCAYLSGLLSVTSTGQRALEIEGRLARGGDNAFALRLAAYAHEQRGEIADMHAALARAARLSDSPLTKALLSRSLGAMGRQPEAVALTTALRRELTAIHLRRRPTHPLLGPELAYAFLLN
ncbi:MAG: hypothetical protein NXI31_22810 [bacterium]|nr:hypothetical protein [bacterium]